MSSARRSRESLPLDSRKAIMSKITFKLSLELLPRPTPWALMQKFPCAPTSKWRDGTVIPEVILSRCEKMPVDPSL